MPDTPFPLITIAISCYNSQDTVARAVQSALAQDWPNKEIIIVDDCSADSSVTVVEQEITEYRIARLIRHEQNQGIGGTRNTLIDNANGSFIAFFDDDDVSAPDRVRRQYERITAYEKKYDAELVICHTARMQTYPNGFERYEPTMGTDESAIAPHGKAVADRILTGRLSPGVIGSNANCARMARTEMFRRMGGYDASLRRAEDTDFDIRLALAGGHFAGIAEPLVFQTMTMGSEKTLEAEYEAQKALLVKHKDYLEPAGWYDFCQKWLEIRRDHLKGRHLGLLQPLLLLLLKHPVKLFFKLYWSIPAHKTRRVYRQWHHKKLDE